MALSSAPVLPRLLYVGDVPVEEALAGSLILYRLLGGYPADRLKIVENPFKPSQPERRLPDVEYALVRDGYPRVLLSRLTPHLRYGYFFTAARSRARKLLNVARAFNAQAILTVGHGYRWAAAASLADQLGLPLHIVMHDNWRDTVNLTPRLTALAERRFGRAWRQAASRFCVSPYMTETFTRRFLAPAAVLYPSRAKSGTVDVLPAQDPEPGDTRVSPAHEASPGSAGILPTHGDNAARPFRIAYGGSIDSDAYATMVVELANALGVVGGELLVFGPTTIERLRGLGLLGHNLSLRAPVRPDGFIQAVREQADALFIPMSFDEAHRENMELGFPSKFADYTATGLPLLIWGPPTCSAVRWAMVNPGAADVVAESSPAALSAAVCRLAASPEYRRSLGAEGSRVGGQLFSHESVTRIFLDALTKANAKRED